ncbi:TPA: hypothetical protein NIJ25_005844 [Pseudomonas aeruginosa]|nr:hypothetical protein [Pseudomonas aeruginosa]
MPDMREEFEAAIFAEVNEQRTAEGEFVLQQPEGLLARDDDGSYSIRWVKSAWWAWQASRAALRVELPDDGIEDCRRDWSNSCRDNFDTGYCYATDRITQALQQAGIEVK